VAAAQGYACAAGGGDAGTRTQLSTSAADLQSAPVTLPSTAPWLVIGVIDGTCTHFDEVHGLAPRLLRTRPP